MSAALNFSYISSFTFCLLVLVALSTKSGDATLCLDDERQAVLQFKHDLIDETGQLASWVGETSDCCKWAGILCDNNTGHVHNIHLPGICVSMNYNTIKEYEEAIRQRLRGDISPSILYLKQLEHLDLSCNDFRGIQIPRFIGSLGNLRYLNLSRSGFGGTIPPQLGNLTELGVLCLGSFYDDDTDEYESTSIMNMQWLSGLRSLRHLDMSGVDLTKATDWFQVINTLPSLVQLFSGCRVTGVLWDAIASWCNIPRFFVFSLSDVLHVMDGSTFNSKKKEIVYGILIIACWRVWKARNDKIFNGMDSSMTHLIADVKSLAYLWFKYRHKEGSIDWRNWCNFSFPLM